jgi:flagellin-specific chaperone FliS
MARKRFSPEQIITMLQEQVLDTLEEAKVLVEAWRKAYNRFRLHS